MSPQRDGFYASFVEGNGRVVVSWGIFFVFLFFFMWIRFMRIGIFIETDCIQKLFISKYNRQI